MVEVGAVSSAPGCGAISCLYRSGALSSTGRGPVNLWILWGMDHQKRRRSTQCAQPCLFCFFRSLTWGIGGFVDSLLCITLSLWCCKVSDHFWQLFNYWPLTGKPLLSLGCGRLGGSPSRHGFQSHGRMTWMIWGHQMGHQMGHPIGNLQITIFSFDFV